jgi:hypothetical protein
VVERPSTLRAKLCKRLTLRQVSDLFLLRAAPLTTPKRPKLQAARTGNLIDARVGFQIAVRSVRLPLSEEPCADAAVGKASHCFGFFY